MHPLLARTLASASLAMVLGSGCKRSPASDADTDGVVQGLAAIAATCAAASGSVELLRGGSAHWEPARVGATLRAGDEVRTGALSSVRLELLAGGTVILDPEARIAIDSGGTAGGDPGRVSVRDGVVRAIMARAPDRSAPPPLVLRDEEGAETRVTLAEGEAKTAVRVSRSGGATEFAVTIGAVVLSRAGASRPLRAGEALEVAERELGPTETLIPFPESIEPGIDARFLFRPGRPIRLAWRPVDGATGYRVQLARDLSFQQLEAVAEVNGHRHNFSPREGGLHVWRVAARDAAGRLGEYGFARRLYCERQEPRDLLVGPVDGADVRYVDQPPRVAFTWQSAGETRQYQLIVASGPDLLREKIFATTSAEQRVETGTLVAGRYSWGVYVLDRGEALPIFVKPRQLVIRKVSAPTAHVPGSISEWGR